MKCVGKIMAVGYLNLGTFALGNEIEVLGTVG
jgi:hypothetical protein